MQNLNEAIRERAYLLWIADGQPDRPGRPLLVECSTRSFDDLT
jgi:hypothetical protein